MFSRVVMPQRNGITTLLVILTPVQQMSVQPAWRMSITETLVQIRGSGWILLATPPSFSKKWPSASILNQAHSGDDATDITAKN